jgi:hypothetical protein
MPCACEQVLPALFPCQQERQPVACAIVAIGGWGIASATAVPGAADRRAGPSPALDSLSQVPPPQTAALYRTEQAKQACPVHANRCSLPCSPANRSASLSPAPSSPLVAGGLPAPQLFQEPPTGEQGPRHHGGSCNRPVPVAGARQLQSASARSCNRPVPVAGARQPAHRALAGGSSQEEVLGVGGVAPASRALCLRLCAGSCTATCLRLRRRDAAGEAATCAAAT